MSTEPTSPNRPCICIGWPTIALLAQGKTVELSDAVLIPDDLLFNTAAQIARGELGGKVDESQLQAMGGQEVDSTVSQEEYQKFVEESVKFCHCAERARPCDGVLAGGVCDMIPEPGDLSV